MPDNVNVIDGPAGKKIILLSPRGFCAGVVRAIDVVRIALDLYGAPIYVRKEIVHNRHVVDELRRAGAIFVEELNEVPEGARVIFSAHGVSPAVRTQAKERHLQVIDAPLPQVANALAEVVRSEHQAEPITVFGLVGHEGAIGTQGEAPKNFIVVADEVDVDRHKKKDLDGGVHGPHAALPVDEAE